MRRPRLFLLCSALLVSAPAARAQEIMTRYTYENRVDIDLAAIFEPKWDVMVPMRDGVRLHTEIYVPRNQTEPLPIMLERTPYYANPQEQEYSIRLDWYEEFFDEGYIFVLQDLRGRYDSEGDFRTLRPNRTPDDIDGTDESTDFYDTIDWLVNNVPGNNGRVGTWGISYGGFLSTRAMVDPHPALAAVSPQATCADMFIGDDFHHNGAFRLSYAYEAAERFELPPELWPPQGPWDKYRRYLEMGPLSRVNPELLHGRSRMWNAFVEHPNMDEYWETEMCGVFPYLQGVTVPALHVTGWYDAEDFYGPIEVYKQLEADDENNENFLVLGPWRHGGWTFDEVGRMVLDIDLGSPTARYFRDEIHARWFAYWLKDKGSLPEAEVITFQTGSNEWKQYDSWPAEGMVPRNVYLRADGVVSFDPPPASDGDAYDEYVSDPGKPGAVPVPADPLRSLALLAGRGSALRRRPSRRADLGVRAPRGGVLDHRRHRRPPPCLDERRRRGLDREADRRLPRRSPRPRTPRLPVHGRRRGLPRALPQQLPRARPRRPERNHPLHDQPARPRPPLPGRPQDHGAGPEHLVPDHRQEPADLGAEHLQSRAGGLRKGDEEGVPLGRAPHATSPFW